MKTTGQWRGEWRALAAVAALFLVGGACRADDVDLTGKWSGDTMTVWVRQVGDEVWWLAKSNDGGKAWTHAFHGKLSGKEITGQFADVPPGENRNQGSIKAQLIVKSGTVMALKGKVTFSPANNQVDWSIERASFNINGELKDGDPKDTFGDKGGPHKVHTTTMTEGKYYQIDMVTSDFEAFVRLEDDSKKPLAWDYTAWCRPGTNSRIFFKAPKSGSYRIIATTWDGQTGAYVLTQTIWPEVRPQPLKVVGKQIQTPDGKAVRLRGVNIPSMEWGAGENCLASLDEALDWGANLVRLPLSQDSWLRPVEDYWRHSSGDYRENMQNFVARAAAKKCYVLLDLHWSNAGHPNKDSGQHCMPDENSITFWKDVARTFANHPAVLFDLYNEPHDVSWEVWRDGGKVVEGELVFETPGMQKLLDFCRATGAENIVVVGGLDYGYDLTGISAWFKLTDQAFEALKNAKVPDAVLEKLNPLKDKGLYQDDFVREIAKVLNPDEKKQFQNAILNHADNYALKDPKCNAVVYGSHLYSSHKWWSSGVPKVGQGWDANVMSAGKKYPVLIGEFGGTNYYNKSVIDYAETNGLHWTNWCMHPGAAPCLITDWNYTPSGPGVVVKSALRAARSPAVGKDALDIYELTRRATLSPAVGKIALKDGMGEVKGKLQAKDIKDDDNFQSYCKIYAIKLEAGKTYRLDCKSDWHNRLRIEDAKGKPLAAEDGTDAQIIFKCKTAGEYRVSVTSEEAATTGVFIVTVATKETPRSDKGGHPE